MRPTSPRDPASRRPAPGRRAPRHRSRRVPLGAIALAGLALGACGGEDDDDAPVEVLGTARVVEAPPVVEIEARTVLKSVPVNALARPEPEPVVEVEPEPEPEPAATIATDIEEVVIAPEATTADVEAVGDAVGATVTAPVEADAIAADTPVTPSVPDATSDNPDWTSLVSDWTGSVELLRRRFGEDLDAEELLATGGERGQVVSIMENRLGVGREEAERRLDEFASSPEGS